MYNICLYEKMRIIICVLYFFIFWKKNFLESFINFLKDGKFFCKLNN